MAHFGTIMVPRTAIVPFAVAAARRANIVAIVTAVMCATCVLLGVADAMGHWTGSPRNDAAMIFWIALFGLICGYGVRRAKRAKSAATRAASDPGSTWSLVGKLVVAADDRGMPVFEHSFKITRSQARLVSGQTSDQAAVRAS